MSVTQQILPRKTSALAGNKLGQQRSRLVALNFVKPLLARGQKPITPVQFSLFDCDRSFKSESRFDSELRSCGNKGVSFHGDYAAIAESSRMHVTTECYLYDRGMTRIESASFDDREDQPDSFFASLLWPETGEHLTRETFLKYRKIGGLAIMPNNTMEDVHLAGVSPLTMIASDGHLENGKGHPRTSSTYSTVLSQYVREEKALGLVTALRKMTFLPAQRLEKRAPVFVNKGRIRVGADADITVFDPATVRDRSTYEKSTTLSEGILFVL